MEEPTYERAYQIFRSFAYEILAVPVDQSGMSVKELKKDQRTACLCDAFPPVSHRGSDADRKADGAFAVG